MQAQGMRPGANGRGRTAGAPQAQMGGGSGGQRAGRPNMATLRRAIGYVGRYPRVALLAYGSLFVATLAQLMVPQLIQSIIDTIVQAFVAMHNDIFARNNRVSYSNHNTNHTREFRIRTTNNDEKVHLFIGQVLVLALQALVLLISTLIIFSFTNATLTITILPILPIAFIF